MAHLASGTMVAGKYRVERVLGEGGMGVVYLAVNTAIDKPVALKLLTAAATPESAARFAREARSAAKLRHPNVVEVHDLGETDTGEPFIVMEALEGETLGDRIRRGPLLPGDAVGFACDLLRALSAAHAVGLVHRDVKPANIFLANTTAGTPVLKVLDFGIAAVTDTSEPALTGTGITLGSALYMSPEQLRALPIDHRTDLWSAGVTVYEMLTGAVPFTAPSIPAIIVKIVTEPAPLLRAAAPELDVGLERIVAKALATDREARFQSAQDMIDALAGWANAHAPTTFAPSTAPPPAPSSVPKRLPAPVAEPAHPARSSVRRIVARLSAALPGNRRVRLAFSLVVATSAVGVVVALGSRTVARSLPAAALVPAASTERTAPGPGAGSAAAATTETIANAPPQPSAVQIESLPRVQTRGVFRPCANCPTSVARPPGGRIASPRGPDVFDRRH